MQVYAAICDIRNNMICKDELREIGLNTNAILDKLQIGHAEIGKHIDRNHNEILTTIKSTLESLRGEVELPDLLENIDPERHKKDARIYCARLACYVWSNLNKSKRTCIDYVFREAKEGSRLYADCKLARAYMQKFRDRKIPFDIERLTYRTKNSTKSLPFHPVQKRTFNQSAQKKKNASDH